MTFKKKFIFGLKIFITLLLCGFLIYKGDWQHIFEKLQEIRLSLLSILVALILTGILISTIKWRLLLSVHKVHYSFLTLLKYNMIALFLNNFLPTKIGGDFYRVYKTYYNENSKTGAVVAIVAERYTGLFALVTLGTIGGIIGSIRYASMLLAYAVILGVIIICCLVAFVIILHIKKVKSWLLRLKWFPDKIKQLIDNIGEYQRSPVRTILTLVISFIFHCTVIFKFYLLIYLLHENCNFLDLAVVMTISTLVAMIPVSLNGIGIMDTSFIYTIGTYGVSYDAALMAMILNRALLILFSLFGGLLYLFDQGRLSTKEHGQNLKVVPLIPD